jgi:hypothetical protein
MLKFINRPKCVTIQDGEPTSNGKAGANGAPSLKVTVGTVRNTSAWVLKEGQFEEGLVGGKSRSLGAMRGKLPQGVALPASVAIPFGSFERTLQVRDSLLWQMLLFTQKPRCIVQCRTR